MLIFFGSSVYNQCCALDYKQNMTIFVTDLVVIPVKELLSKHVNT